MNSKKSLLTFCSAIIVATAVAYGCSDDDNDNVTPPPATGDGGSTTSSSGSTTSSSGTSGTTSSGGDSGAKPPPPALGAQIDRFGRPAINTAANQTFTADAVRGAAQDAYNIDGNAGGWVAANTTNFGKSLGIYDGIDRTCGNQAFADQDAGAGAARYNPLASLLADDRQWLNTASTTCTTYLAVELNATGASPNTDCGGRKLTYDVIDDTYHVVGGPTVTDGINAVAAKTNGTAFPYLAAPL